MCFLLSIQIESDSGVGPYTENIQVANCSYKNGIWCRTKSVPSIVDNQIVMRDDTRSIEEWYRTNSADCKITVMRFEQQENYYR